MINKERMKGCGEFKHILFGWCGKTRSLSGYFGNKERYYICKDCKEKIKKLKEARI